MRKDMRRPLAGYLCSALLFLPVCARAQATQSALPPAPAPGFLVSLASPAWQNGQTPPPMGTAASPAASAPATNAAPQDTGPGLTLAQAEQMAIKNNPHISVARLLALAQAQVTREVRSVEMPTAEGALTAVDAHDNSLSLIHI